MPNFLETSRDALARMGRRLADRLIFDRAGQFWADAEAKPVAQYRQPLRLIRGMPSAPEPCLLPMHWSAAQHPKNAVAQLKVDGVRALYIDTSIVTREALPLDCALHCLPSLHELERLYGCKMVFDGEYLEPGGFQATIAAMRAGEGVGSIWLFDAVPYDEWARNRFTQPLEERVRRLCQLEVRLGSPFIRSLGLTSVPAAADAQSYAETVWARGDEGIVVKNARDTYHRGKSKIWLKLKKRQTFDGVIVDVLVKDGRATAILVKMPADSPSPGKVVKIGSNIPDDLRETMARLDGQHSFIGLTAEVCFTDTTDTGNLRGGYFVRMRSDKGGNHA